MTSQRSVVLVAINARYGHCSMACRSLIANLDSDENVVLLENELSAQPFQIASDILAHNPRLIGFSVYLWNLRLVRETVAIIREIACNIRIVLGGPEIVPESAPQWENMVDDIVVGEGETAMRNLCRDTHDNWQRSPETKPRIIETMPEDMASLELPYAYYSDADISHRTIFTESSRGCPFSCVYCTSYETSLRLVPLSKLLPALDTMLKRGVVAFRFLDRSFNVAEKHACELLDFFLARQPERLQLHFEVIPCRLNKALRDRIAAFPPEVLHLEVGIQTLNKDVAQRIGRYCDIPVMFETIDFLMQAKAQLHVDLIFGLPGEDEKSFARGFNEIVTKFDPPELQVNLLKKLPGTPLARREEFNDLRFNPNPPYELLESDVLNFQDINRLQRFARTWELVHNRALCPEAARAIWQSPNAHPFQQYMALSAKIFGQEGRLHAIGAKRLKQHVADFLIETCQYPSAKAIEISGI